MRYCRRVWVLLLFATALLPCAARTNPIDVPIATLKHYYPYSYVEGDKTIGLYVRLLRAIDNRLPEYRINLSALTLHEARDAVKDGTVLAIMNTYLHGDDWPYLYPYSLPIATEQVITVCHQAVVNPERRHWPADYAGLTMGNVVGFEGWLDHRGREKIYTGSINFLEVPDMAIALRMVVFQRLDCAFMERGILPFALRKIAERDDIDFSVMAKPMEVTHLKTEFVHLGYSVAALQSGAFPYARDFQRKFDFAVTALRRSGKLAELQVSFDQ